MKMKFIFLICLMSIALQIFGQQKVIQIAKGTVSYVTARNVYVKFDNTVSIKPGDILQLASNNSSCLIVRDKSSSSCICTVRGDCEVNKGDEVVYAIKDESRILLSEYPCTEPPLF